LGGLWTIAVTRRVVGVFVPFFSCATSPYTICETGVNPANCSATTVIVGVGKLETLIIYFGTPNGGVAGGIQD
jgi:hypothetical protein